MINQYPLWKYILILSVLFISALYALPNLYGKDPAVLISPLRAQEMDSEQKQQIENLLKDAGIVYKGMEDINSKLMVRFSDTESQLKASSVLGDALENRFVVAQNLAASTPDWLRAINGQPMYLGLDLQGGIHFLMEVDMDAAINREIDRFIGEIKSSLRDKTIRHLGVNQNEDAIRIRFNNVEVRSKAVPVIKRISPGIAITESEAKGMYYLEVSLTEDQKKEARNFALEQNITTLRNRVNELGVAEPVIQRHGDSRIIVQLPGVQDPDQAKNILGATATLEIRMVDEKNLNIQEIVSSGRTPAGTRVYYRRDGSPVLLRKRVVLTGDYITHASSRIDAETNRPAVSINLDAKGGSRFSNFTKDHVKDSMAVVFIETRIETRVVDGERKKFKKKVEEVISVATIQERLGQRFQITGIDSMKEAYNLALLLRSGALAAPIEIIEERTIGPSLGKDNIDQGFNSVIIGFILVLVFMAVYYKTFGLVANLALALNLVVVVALLSILQATLTLPGIAGIVLTVGMAVDANVLIFERIREELRIGNSPQASISAGYEKAFSTIADANVTTLIAAIVLFSFGSGPIKGFAITLSLGILTSMFTAIMGTRGVINLIYGGRKKVEKLAV